MAKYIHYVLPIRWCRTQAVIDGVTCLEHYVKWLNEKYKYLSFEIDSYMYICCMQNPLGLYIEVSCKRGTYFIDLYGRLHKDLDMCKIGY